MTISLGQLGRQMLTGATGGAKFIAALASGDIADDRVVRERREICVHCPTRVRKALTGMDAPADWCGNPLLASDEPPSCGCLIYGKTLVASESCPQDKWDAVHAST